MRRIKVERYSSGCKKIDELLGGGFEVGTVTQLFGVAGSGKTNICLQLAIETVKRGKKVVYIDSEGFSPERFGQIAGEDVEKIAKDIVIYEPLNFEQQYSAIKDLEKMIDGVGVIIHDSAVSFYRFELDEERGIELKRELANQIACLLQLARKYDVAVVITNQIYMDIDNGKFHPIGGNMVEHLSKAIIQLEKQDKGKRRAILRKHRSRPEGVSCEFVLTQDGVRDI
ncbi:MAG: DNA repair and recombination protein RadB [Methanocellales archaeon]|nr:DNA repair and recombination protein RadB [Methanocellales archaeon]